MITKQTVKKQKEERSDTENLNIAENLTYSLIQKIRLKKLNKEDIKELVKENIIWTEEEWMKAIKLLEKKSEEEENKLSLETKNNLIEKFFIEKTIKEFLEKYIKSLDEDDKIILKKELYNKLKNTKNIDRIKDYLADILYLDSKEKLSEKLRKKPSNTSYIWSIIQNIIIVFIVFGVFGSTHGEFQTITVSLLVLIYISIDSSFSLNAINEQKKIAMLSKEIKKIKKILGKNSEYEYDNNEDEVQKILDKTMKNVGIKSIFYSIISIIALLNLLGAL